MSYPPSPRGSPASPAPSGILLPHGSPAASMIAAAQGTGLVVLPPPPLTFKNLTIHTSLMSTKQQLQQQQHQYHVQLNAALRKQMLQQQQQQQQHQHYRQHHDTQSLRFDRQDGTTSVDTTLGSAPTMVATAERRRICSDTTMAAQSGDQESQLLTNLPTTPNGEPFPPPEHWNYTMARFQASLIPLSQIEDPPKFFESLDDQSVIHHEDDGELPAPPPPYLVSMLNAMKHSGSANNSQSHPHPIRHNHHNHHHHHHQNNNNNNDNNNNFIHHGINHANTTTTASATLMAAAVNDKVSTNSTCHATFAPHADSSSRDHPDQHPALKKHDHLGCCHNEQPRSMTPPAGLHPRQVARLIEGELQDGTSKSEDLHGRKRRDHREQRPAKEMFRISSSSASSRSSSSSSSSHRRRNHLPRRQRMPSEGVEDVVFYDGDQLHVAQLRMGKTEATTATTTAVTKGTGAEVKEDNNSSDVHCQNQEHTHTHLQQQCQLQRQQHPRTVSYQWSSRAIDDGDSSSSVVTSVENVPRPRSLSHASQHSAIDTTVVQPLHTQQEQEQQQQQQSKNDDPTSQKIQVAPNRLTVGATLSANLLARGNEGREDARTPQQQHLLHSPARPDSLHRSLSAGSGSSSNEWQRRPSLPQSVMDTRSSTAMLKRSTAKAYDRHSPIQSHSPQQQRSPTASVSRNSGAAGSGVTGSSVGVGSQTTQDPFLGFPYNNSSLLMAATTEAEMSGQRRKSRLSSHEGEIKPKNSTSLAARNVKKDLGTAQGNAPGPPSSQSKEGKVARNDQQQQHRYPQAEGERPRKTRIDSGHDASDTAEHGGHLEIKAVAINGKNTQWTMDPEPSETVTSSPRLIESPDTASLSADGLVESPTNGEHAISVHHTSNKNNSCSPRRRRPRPLSVPVNGLDFADLKIALGEGTPQPRGKTSTDSPIQHQEPRTPILPVDFGGFPQLNSSALMTLMDDQWSDQHKDSKRKERRKKKKGSSNGDPQRRKSRDLSLSPGLPSSDPHRHHRLHHQQPHPADGAEYQRQRVYSQNPIMSHDSLESTQIQSTCSAGTSASAATTSNINQQPLPSPSQPSAFQQISSNHSGSVRQQMLRMNKRHLIGSSSVASNRKDESFPQENSAEANEGSPRFANGYEDAVQCDSPPVVQHQQQKQRQSYAASSISSLEDTDNNREYKSLVRDGPESLDCALSDGAISVPIRPLAQSDSPVQYRHSHMPTTSHQQAPGRSGKGEPLERIPSGMVLNHKNDDRPRPSVTPIQSNIFEHGQDDRLVEMPPIRARTLASSNRVRPTSAPLGSSISDTAMQATLAGSGGSSSVAGSVNAGTAGGATADTRNVSSSAPKSSMFFSIRTSSSPTKKSMHPFLGAMSLTLGARRQFFAEQKKQRNLEANEAAAAVAAVAAQASASFSTSIGSLDYVGGGDDESNHTAATGSRWYGNGGGVEGERGNGNGGVGGGVNGRAPNSSAESSGATTIGSAEQLEQQKKKRKEKFLEGLKRFLLRPTPNGGRRSVMIHDEGSTGGSGIGDMDSIAGSGDDRQWNQHHQLQHRKYKSMATNVQNQGGEEDMSPPSPTGLRLHNEQRSSRSIRRMAAASSLRNGDEDHDNGGLGDDETRNDFDDMSREDHDNDIMCVHHPFHASEAYHRHGRYSQDISTLFHARDSSSAQYQHHQHPNQQRQRQRHSLMNMMMGSATADNESASGHDVQTKGVFPLMRGGRIDDMQQNQQYVQRRKSARNIQFGGSSSINGGSNHSPVVLESSSTAVAVATISGRKPRPRSGLQNATIFTQWRAQATAEAAAIGGDGQQQQQHAAVDHGASLHP